MILAAGSPAAAMSERGINGLLDEVLFHLLHGTLWYLGMAPLPPLGIHGADRMTPSQHAAALDLVRARMAEIETIPAIAYRTQNDGDYDDDLVLRDHLTPRRRGITAHLRAHQEQVGAP